MTNLRLQEVLTIHRTDLTKILQQLVRASYLVRNGIGRWTRYELSNLPEIVSDQNDTMLADDGTSDGSPDGTSDGSPAESDGTWQRAALQASDPELWTELLEIAQPARLGQTVPPDELQELIIALCRRAGWLTREDLGRLLSRSSTNLRDRVLNPMVSTELLKLRYGNRNHPQQAYAAAGN
jgi:ATP-dependent DNA helicase RecG